MNPLEEPEQIPAALASAVRSRNQLEMLQATFDNSPVMISCFDPVGRLLFVNREWQRVFGWTLEEARGIDLFEQAYPDPAERERARGLIREGAHSWTEFRTRTRDGRTIDTSWTGAVLSDGTRLGLGMDLTERKRGEAALRESERRLRAVFDTALDSILIVDDEGRFIDANPAACVLLGRERDEILQLHVEQTTAPGYDFPTAWAALGRDGSLQGEWGFLRPDGSIRYVDFTARSRFQPGCHLGILRDITDRKLLEAAVRLNETYMREGQRLSQTGSWAWNVASGALFWSDETYRIVGLDPATSTPSHALFLGLLHPEDGPRVRDEIERAQAARADFESHFRVVRPDGSIRHLHSLARPSRDGTGAALQYVGVVRDVTVQYRADERLQQSFVELQALTEKLRVVREEERSRIAREVHDEIGQALTALQMDVAWLQKRTSAEAGDGLHEKLADMSTLADATLDAVQRIASELRPGVLDELGLEAAIEWYGRDFQNRTGVHCRTQFALGGVPVDAPRSTALFRILQEALTNVWRHAGATRVEVRFAAPPGRLLLEVRDNGAGIPPERLGDMRSLGLIGMRERARSLGGDVAFLAGPGKGTTVSVSVPL